MYLFEELWNDSSWNKLCRQYLRNDVDATYDCYIKWFDKSPSTNKEKTITDVLETLNEEQKTAVYALIGELNNDETEGGENMKHKETTNKSNHKSPDIRRLIKNVKFNPPATIVFWTDNTKTVVKCNGEDYDPEKGLAMCISKKMLGNKGNYYEVFKKWLPKRDDSDATQKVLQHIEPKEFKFNLGLDNFNEQLFKAFTGVAGETAIKSRSCHTCKFYNEDEGCMNKKICVGLDKWASKDE